MPQSSRFDLSFLTEQLLEVHHCHRQLMRQLLSGEQPDRVPIFEYAAIQLPAVGPYDRREWLAEGLAQLRREFDSYCDPVVCRIPAFSLSRYGLHFTSAVMGCPIHDKQDRAWCTSLDVLGRSLEDFCVPNLDENDIFQDMLSLVKFVAEATEHRLPIELPFLAEPLLAGVDLFGSEFLAALANDDGLADRVLADISSAVLTMRSRLHAAIPSADLRDYHTSACPMPREYTFVHGCTTHLVSPQTYRDHVAKLDSAHLTHEARGGCFHLCGEHIQHLRTWRDMPCVRAVQLNDRACADLEQYWSQLRSDQFVVLWPSENMPLERAMEITQRRRLAVRYSASLPLLIDKAIGS